MNEDARRKGHIVSGVKIFDGGMIAGMLSVVASMLGCLGLWGFFGRNESPAATLWYLLCGIIAVGIYVNTRVRDWADSRRVKMLGCVVRLLLLGTVIACAVVGSFEWGRVRGGFESVVSFSMIWMVVGFPLSFLLNAIFVTERLVAQILDAGDRYVSWVGILYATEVVLAVGAAVVVMLALGMLFV